jgi:DNA-binding response OmpR family regulator
MAEKRLILVVEDDEAMLLGLRHNLEYEGYETVAASDGRDALQKAEKLLPDLVLLDVMLPQLDGFAVLRELRTTQPRLPVIVLTSKSLESDKLNGFQLGADDYVTKPFSHTALVARVQLLLRRSAEARAPEPDAETILNSFSSDQPDLDPPTPSPPLDRASAHAHDYATAGGTLLRFVPRKPAARGKRR